MYAIFFLKEYNFSEYYSCFTDVCFALCDYVWTSLKMELFPRAPTGEQVLPTFLLVRSLMVSRRNSSQENNSFKKWTTCPHRQNLQGALPTQALVPDCWCGQFSLQREAGRFPKMGHLCHGSFPMAYTHQVCQGPPVLCQQAVVCFPLLETHLLPSDPWGQMVLTLN